MTNMNKLLSMIYQKRYFKLNQKRMELSDAFLFKSAENN